MPSDYSFCLPPLLLFIVPQSICTKTIAPFGAVSPTINLAVFDKKVAMSPMPSPLGTVAPAQCPSILI